MILAYQNISKIQALAQGVNAVWANLETIQSNTKWPVIFSGITTMVPIQQALRHGLDYWYVDSGYFGNNKRKTYLRVCKNSIHASGDIVSRPRDRLDQLQLSATTSVDTAPIPRGQQILVVPPDSKQCVHFGIHSAEQWLTQTVSAIQQFTQRPIVIRTRPASRTTRLTDDSLRSALANNVHAMVTFISNSAVEAVLHDIPVISLGPSACVRVSPWTLDSIDSVPDIDAETKEAWMRHLSYCQFTQAEMLSGQAWQILNPR
jgi:hypothetical protein